VYFFDALCIIAREDKILVTNLHQLKGHKATELMNEFLNK